MSIFNKSKKYILYLTRDIRTGNDYYQVADKSAKPMKVGQFFDVKCELLDGKEWVVGKVTQVKDNVITFVIVKEI